MTDRIDVFTQSSIRIKSSLGIIYFDPYQMTEEPHDAAASVACLAIPPVF